MTPADMTAHTRRSTIPAAALSDSLTALATALAERLTANAGEDIDLDALESLCTLVDAQTRYEAQRLKLRLFAYERKEKNK